MEADVKIYVSSLKICTQMECGTRILDFPLKVRRGWRFRHLSDEKVSEDIQAVQLMRRSWFWWREIELPKAYTNAMTLFLQMFHNEPHQDIDCYSFATLVAGLPLHDKKWLHAYWNFRNISGAEIRGPKALFFVNEKSGRFGHAALHIGNGHFLSVQGAGGTLSVSTLEDLQLAYSNFPNLWAVVPKSRDEVEIAIQLIAELESPQC